MIRDTTVPTDRLYQRGTPLDAEEVVNGVRLDDVRSTVLEKDIDWTNVVEQGDDVSYAAASATAHYHYLKLSNVLLCDRIILDARNVPEPVKHVAALMEKRCGLEMEAWSRYLRAQGGGGSICPEQREYYQLLFTQEDVLPALLGVQTINLAADTSYEEFHTHGDPIFQKLTGGLAAENEGAYHDIRDTFRDAIEPLSMQDRTRLLQNMAQQVDLVQLIKQQRSDDVFDPLHSDAEESIRRAGTRIKRFYGEIGLTANIF